RRHTSFSRDWSSDVCSSDLEVAVAHPFLAGDELEQVIDAPETQVARGGAQDARSRVDGKPDLGNGCSKADQQTEPHERQRHVVRSEERRVGKERRWWLRRGR